MSLRTFLVLGFVPLAALCVHPLLAQTHAPAVPYETASSAIDPLHPLAASFEPGVSEEYTIDAGDEIHLDVSGRSELTGNYILGPDGRITIPSVGSVNLAGLTREQAAATVQAAMQPFYKDPFVTVGVVHYTSNHILLLGAVKNPGMQSFDEQPTLLQVLSRGGIGSETGLASDLPMPDRAYIYRGSQELAVVDVKKLLAGGAFSDLRLRRNDVVMIPVENQLISVLGAVKTPGAVRFNSDSTMQVVLSQAGGLAEQAGSNPLIQVVNVASGTSTELRFNQLLDPRHGNDISLHPGDVIFVPSSGFAKFAYVVDKLNPITTVISFAAVAAH